VQVFISYRRDDTAGRAGRLFDALASRLGARNVFQDVAAIAPGADFDREITAAIDRCDAVLVIIGNDWAALTGPAGRRIEDERDYVRREVAAALTSGVAVVPVLVGGASMPTADVLPTDLQPLALRQSVTIRDDFWPEDVDMLIRRLRHDDEPVARRRRWPVLAAGVVVALVIAGIWTLTGIGDGDADSTDDDEITGCPEQSESWRVIDVTGAGTATVEVDVRLVFTARRAWHDEDGGRVYLSVEVRNGSEPTSEAVPYYNQELVETLLVDGLSQGLAQCLTVEGDPNLYPGQRAIGLLGFDLIEDPTGQPLVLGVYEGLADVVITS
jgi:hypothetical protein